MLASSMLDSLKRICSRTKTLNQYKNIQTQEEGWMVNVFWENVLIFHKKKNQENKFSFVKETPKSAICIK